MLFDETCLDLGSIFRCGSIWWKNISDVFHGQTGNFNVFDTPSLLYGQDFFNCLVNNLGVNSLGRQLSVVFYDGGLRQELEKEKVVHNNTLLGKTEAGMG